MRWIAAILACLMGSAVRAEVTEIHIAQQFSMGYLEFDVMKHRDLLAKYVAASGLPPVTVTWVTFSGPDLMNESLLSGSIDVASGGLPGLLTIWAKTKGTPQEVRGIATMSQQTLMLNTRNPMVTTIRDFTDADRIAVPAVKVSAQAVLLEMAAAKEWGDAHFDKLDHLTFSLSPPDATAGLMAGGGDFDSAFTVPPFEMMQLANPAIHTVLTSDQILGGPSSGGVAWTTKRFHDENPKLYQALLDAMREASDFIAQHPRQTVEYYAEDTKSKIDKDLMNRLMTDPRFKYTLVPAGTLQWAAFMHKTGRIKAFPSSWKDVYWPEVWSLGGS